MVTRNSLALRSRATGSDATHSSCADVVKQANNENEICVVFFIFSVSIKPFKHYSIRLHINNFICIKVPKPKYIRHDSMVPMGPESIGDVQS